MRNQHLLAATMLLGTASADVSAAPNSVPAKPVAAKAAPGLAPRAAQAPFNCTANASWFTAPSLPTEVKKSGSDGSSTFCDFYQFTWQTFAYLMAASKTDANVRNFQDSTQYNQLEVKNDGTPANSCDDKHDSNTLFVRTVKHVEGGSAFLIPQKIGQAGGDATIYDQQGNVVYYDVRFSKGMCDVSGIKQLQNFPGGTTELKTAWRVMGPGDDASRYITMDAKIGSQPTTTKLGMVGFHVAAATPDHPEFVWATFEHSVNSPTCVSPTTLTGWSFASKTCSQSLQIRDPLGIVQCQFNDAQKATSTTGSASQICREYPYGSAPSDLKFGENTQDITSLNNNVRPYLVGNFAVLANYFNVGDLWLSDVSKSSIVGPPGIAQVSNQRGSLRLANTVAETNFQSVDLTQSFVSNCFGCHNFVGTGLAASGKNTTSGALSHIFDDIAIGVGQCLDVQAASLINSQPQAKTQCPGVCTNASAQFAWNGQWTNQDAKTRQQLPMTVCGCCASKIAKH